MINPNVFAQEAATPEVQPFPTVALIGPANVAELDDSLRALDVELTSQVLAYLDLHE